MAPDVGEGLSEIGLCSFTGPNRSMVVARPAPMRGRARSLLPFSGPGCSHVKKDVVSTADRVSTQHLRHLRHGPSEPLLAVLIVLVEHHEHERL